VPKTTRSAQEIDAVRDEILNCALDILAKHGYENLSMLKVGHKTKMTAANLYNYYRNKDELLIAIHKKAFSMLYDILLSAIDSADTPAGRYKKLIYAFVDFGTKNKDLYDIMFNRRIKQYSDYVGTPMEAMSDAEYHSSLRVLDLAIAVILDYNKTRPTLKKANPKDLAIQKIGALHGIISLYNSGSLSTMVDDPKNTMRKFVDRIMQ